MERRCPDCGVRMESVTLQTNGGYELQVISEEKRGGILGSLGMNERLDIQPVACPECGLLRTYVGGE
ncbi:hypothetical protein BRD20_06750 [Halobacteriales archaeon SW_8_65_20]|nr:MAG: hypothetical protein BRD20_06750 [Halobacteriales archaeon SW_8_65_20]